MVDSDFKVGMLVRHPKRPEWGPGKVLALAGSRVIVCFRDVVGSTFQVATKTIDTSRVLLETASLQADPMLDSVPGGGGESQPPSHVRGRRNA
jgi:hypothetical protein